MGLTFGNQWTNQKSLERSEKLERWRDSARSSSVKIFLDYALLKSFELLVILIITFVLEGSISQNDQGAVPWLAEIYQTNKIYLIW